MGVDKEGDTEHDKNAEKHECLQSQVMTSYEVKDISDKYQALVDKVWLVIIDILLILIIIRLQKI